MPEVAELQRLSIAAHKVTASAINSGGQWLAFGVAARGQLLVWEWQSERHVLKQSGHYFDMLCAAYAPLGRYIATGAEDSTVKLWNLDDGYATTSFLVYLSSSLA